MRQVDLKPGDVIVYQGKTPCLLVLGRDADETLIKGREGGKCEYIRYLNLSTGVSSPWLRITTSTVKGEVIRGGETIWLPEGEGGA